MCKDEKGGREGLSRGRTKEVRQDRGQISITQSRKSFSENKKTILQSRDKNSTFNSHIGIHCIISMGDKNCPLVRNRKKVPKPLW